MQIKMIFGEGNIFIKSYQFFFTQTIVPSGSTWRETKDAVLAVICGGVAVAVGVAGVIIMTRRLIDEDEHFPFNTPTAQTKTRGGGGDILPTISEECDNDTEEHEPLLKRDLYDLENIECGRNPLDPPDMNGRNTMKLNTISEDDNEME